MIIEHNGTASSKNNTHNFSTRPLKKLLWINIGDREFSLVDDHGNEIVISPFNGSKFFMAKLHGSKKGSFIIVPVPMSFGACKMICEQLAQNHMSLEYAYSDTRDTFKSSHRRLKFDDPL